MDKDNHNPDDRYPDDIWHWILQLGRRFWQYWNSPRDSAAAGCLRPSVILGTLFIVASFLVIDMREPTLVGRRFDREHTPGATANAVEKLAAYAEWPRASELFAIGVLLLIFARLGDVVTLLDDLRRADRPKTDGDAT